MTKIDIISGFLGAGKTTLIKRLLEPLMRTSETIVIIENEFGKVGIDGTLLKKEGIEVFEITQGCICCSMKNDFIYTLKEILAVLEPDRIIFEPSGLFVPDDVLDIIKSPEFSSKCTINSLITVVDSTLFLKLAAKNPLFLEKQVAAADTLVLSKTPSVSDTEKQLLISRLMQINRKAEIITDSWDGFDESTIAGLLGHYHGTSNDTDQEVMLNIKAALNCNEKSEHSFESVEIHTNRVFNEDELHELLIVLKDSRFGNVLRGKGILKSNTGSLEFNYIDGEYEINRIVNIRPGKACFIGGSLNRELLQGYFE